MSPIGLLLRGESGSQANRKSLWMDKANSLNNIDFIEEYTDWRDNMKKASLSDIRAFVLICCYAAKHASV